MSRISVIIPNYNRANLVGETIENMLCQSLAPYEVIVVDDGSTDDSVKVIRSFGSKVTLIEQPNKGPGAARNRGMETSSGEFIQFMDSDDLASLNKFEIQFSALQASGADFAYCPWVRTKFQEKRMMFTGPVMQGNAIPAWKSMLEWQLGSWCLIFQNCLFRRTILEHAGKYRTDLMPSEDSEYLIRILLNGARPVFTKECLVFYRTHDMNQITSSGTSARQRALDWMNYLEIVGQEIEPRLKNFQVSTRQEIALIVYRHNRYCRKMGWPTLSSANPLARLSNSVPRFRLIWADYADRLHRKLSRLPASTPNSLGLELRKPTRNDEIFAESLGYKLLIQ